MNTKHFTPNSRKWPLADDLRLIMCCWFCFGGNVLALSCSTETLSSLCAMLFVLHKKHLITELHWGIFLPFCLRHLLLVLCWCDVMPFDVTIQHIRFSAPGHMPVQTRDWPRDTEHRTTPVGFSHFLAKNQSVLEALRKQVNKEDLAYATQSFWEFWMDVFR